MDQLRVAVIQLPWSGSVAKMEADIELLIKDAVNREARMVCLPEFSLLPYFPSTTDKAGYDWAETLDRGPSNKFFSQMAKSYDIYVLGSFFESGHDDEYYDTATIFAPNGKLIGTTRKIHIPEGEGYNESSFFIGGKEFPVHKVDDIVVATPTCYDQWFPELSRIYALNGATFIFYPSAIGSEPSDPEIDTQNAWHLVMRGQAIANGVFLGAANRVGVENGVTFYGSSFICDPMGNMLAQAGRDTTEVIVADLNFEVLKRWRDLFPLLSQRRPDVYGPLVQDEILAAAKVALSYQNYF